jgi:hypothetical protein
LFHRGFGDFFFIYMCTGTCYSCRGKIVFFFFFFFFFLYWNPLPQLVKPLWDVLDYNPLNPNTCNKDFVFPQIHKIQKQNQYTFNVPSSLVIHNPTGETFHCVSDLIFNMLTTYLLNTWKTWTTTSDIHWTNNGLMPCTSLASS